MRVSSFVSIGPAVWPAIRNIDHDKQTNKQTDKHIAFYYIDYYYYYYFLFFVCSFIVFIVVLPYYGEIKVNIFKMLNQI